MTVTMIIITLVSKRKWRFLCLHTWGENQFADEKQSRGLPYIRDFIIFEGVERSVTGGYLQGLLCPTLKNENDCSRSRLALVIVGILQQGTLQRPNPIFSVNRVNSTQPRCFLCQILWFWVYQFSVQIQFAHSL